MIANLFYISNIKSIGLVSNFTGETKCMSTKIPVFLYLTANTVLSINTTCHVLMLSCLKVNCKGFTSCFDMKKHSKC